LKEFRSSRCDWPLAAETNGGNDSLDLFHAERHSANSNLRVDTTIEFTDCGRITPELL
jgi:hypothetical protein